MTNINNSMKSKLSKTLVDDLCEGCSKYCTIKEVLQLAAFTDPRTIIQIKCVEIYKFERSKGEEHDIGWQTAMMDWSSTGQAEIFNECYTELTNKSNVIHPRAIYNMIQGRMNEREGTKD